jgi:hypothetical protein
VIFALGCRFAAVAPEEAESVANTFFLRAKLFLALDFLDNNTLGVVQTLLITALYLQARRIPADAGILWGSPAELLWDWLYTNQIFAQH